MKKELPSIFKNSPNKRIENNKNVFYSKYESNLQTNTYNRVENNTYDDNTSFRGAVNNMLKNKEYVFNVPVEVKTRNEVFNTRLVGKVGERLLTSDGRTINLDDVVEIKVKS